jgi:hypothetical protein
MYSSSVSSALADASRLAFPLVYMFLRYTTVSNCIGSYHRICRLYMDRSHRCHQKYVAVQWGLLAHETSVRRGISPVKCVCTQKGKKGTIVDWESPCRRLCDVCYDVCVVISVENNSTVIHAKIRNNQIMHT